MFVVYFKNVLIMGPHLKINLIYWHLKRAFSTSKAKVSLNIPLNWRLIKYKNLKRLSRLTAFKWRKFIYSKECRFSSRRGENPYFIGHGKFFIFYLFFKWQKRPYFSYPYVYINIKKKMHISWWNPPEMLIVTLRKACLILGVQWL